MNRKWSINGRFLTQSLSGVQRYAHETTCELDALVSEGHPLTRGLDLEILVPPGAQTLPHLSAIPIRVEGRAGGHLWEQTVLPRHLGGGLLSLCNSGPISVSRQIVCIHDLNTRAYPASYSRKFRAVYRVLLPLLGRRAARVATVSRYSAGELARYGIAPRNKVFVAPNGHEHATRWRPAHSSDTRHLADGRTVVAIGSPAPHKNIKLLVGIAGELANAGIRLAIAGLSDSRVFQASQHENVSDNVVWLGRLSDDEIAALLRDGLCLAFPSFAEGFGLPALEAMTLGCPVVAANRSSLPEVCGDAALFASPDDPRAWIDHFIRLSRDEALHRALVRKGRLQASRYTWRETALHYLKAIAELDGVTATGYPLPQSTLERSPDA